ncbi:FAD-dependent oxidoreductase, partial [Vibrio parahaemolyticus]
VKKLLESFRGQLVLEAPVQRIRRDAVQGGVWLTLADGREQHYERVVCATHSDQALRLLADASAAETEVLAGIPYSESRVILHTDES